MIPSYLEGNRSSDSDPLRLRIVVFCHHDGWNPPVTSPTDLEPIREELARRTPVELVEMGYVEDCPILRLDC